MHIPSLPPVKGDSIQVNAKPSPSSLTPLARPKSNQAELPDDGLTRARVKHPTDHELRKWLALSARQRSAHDALGAMLQDLADRRERIDQEERYVDPSLHRKSVFSTLALVGVGFSAGMMLMIPFKPEHPNWHSNDMALSAYAYLARLCDELGTAAAPIRSAFALSEEWNGHLSGGSWASTRQVQALSQSWLATSGGNHLIMIPLALFACAMLVLVLTRLCRVR